MIDQEFTYAGVPLMVPPKELYDWVEENIPFNASNYFRTLNYGLLDNSDIVFKNYSENPFHDLKLSSLYWPTGASRFATGFFLVSSEDLEKLPSFDNLGYKDAVDTLGGMRSRVNSKNYYTAEKLVIYNTEIPLAAKMYMLPPRPLLQIESTVVDDAIETRGRFPVPHLESLWVVPLVDDRYWWWWHNTGEFKIPSCSNWEDLFYTIFDNLGYGQHQVLVDPDIPQEYLFPHSLYRKQSYNIRVPLLLDSIAQSCNCRIISHFNGQIEIMHARKSFDALKQPLLTPSGNQGGGKMVLANLDKSKFYKSFPSKSDIGKNSDDVQKQSLNIRDTPGVIPEVVTFVVNNNPIRVNLLNKDGLATQRPLSETTINGDDTLHSQIIETMVDPTDLDSVVAGKMRYFEDTNNQGPDDKNSEPSYYKSGNNSVTVEYQNGDYILDTKNNVFYGPRSDSGWGDAFRGKSLLSKYFKVVASAYKTTGKTACPILMYPPTGVTEKDFNTNQIETFCKTYARDWALYQYADDDISLNGCVPVEQHGMLDNIIFHLSVEDTYTRLIRPPYNDLTEEVYIESYLGDEAACDADTYPCGQCKGMQGDSTTTQLYGFGTSDMFLPYSAILQKTQTVPTGATAATYPQWHKPPYVVKFCLGGAIGTAALDYHFQTTMNVSVYWNGSKVASRTVYGSKSFTCQSGAQSWGRLTFYKTEKTPSYAIVVVDAATDTFSQQEAERPQAMNWYMNMRCVDSIPYPAPRAIACDSKLNEVGGVFTLGMFTSIPVNIQGTSTGIVPNTPICISDSASSTFPCGSNQSCVIPSNLQLKFNNAPSSCKFLKDVVIPLQQSTSDGGWIGIYDQFGPTKDIIQAKLTLVGTTAFKLVLKDIVNASRSPVEINNITTCLCTPFTLTIPGVNLTPFACTPASPNTLQAIITEA